MAAASGLRGPMLTCSGLQRGPIRLLLVPVRPATTGTRAPVTPLRRNGTPSMLCRSGVPPSGISPASGSPARATPVTGGGGAGPGAGSGGKGSGGSSGGGGNFGDDFKRKWDEGGPESGAWYNDLRIWGLLIVAVGFSGPFINFIKERIEAKDRYEEGKPGKSAYIESREQTKGKVKDTYSSGKHKAQDAKDAVDKTGRDIAQKGRDTKDAVVSKGEELKYDAEQGVSRAKSGADTVYQEVKTSAKKQAQRSQDATAEAADAARDKADGVAGALRGAYSSVKELATGLAHEAGSKLEDVRAAAEEEGDDEESNNKLKWAGYTAGALAAGTLVAGGLYYLIEEGKKQNGKKKNGKPPSKAVKNGAKNVADKVSKPDVSTRPPGQF